MQHLSPPPGVLGIAVRKAAIGDVGVMHRDLQQVCREAAYAAQDHLQLPETLRDNTVAEDLPVQRIVGCGSLHLCWADLAEVRAVAVAPGTTKKGVGSLIVDRLIREAHEYGLERVFAFTYVPDFFARFGFVQVEHRSMPLKVYNECFQCPRFPLVTKSLWCCTYED
jgi:amino-acid N-acetyltransferase